MGLSSESGDLTGTSLPRLLLDLYDERYEGALRLSHGRMEKAFLLHGGVPVVAESNRAGESLAAQLEDSGALAPGDRAQVDAHVSRHGCPEARALLDLGLLDAQGVFRALKDQVRRRLVDCFGWPSGSFALDPESTPPADARAFRSDPYALVQEGIATHWSPERVFEALAPRMKLYPVPAGSLARVRAHLQGDEALDDLLAALSGDLTFWQVLQRASTPRALAAAWVLDAAGALSYHEQAPSEEEGDEAPAAQPAIEIVVAQAGAGDAGAARRAARAERAERAPRDAAAADALTREIAEKHGALGELDAYQLLGVEPSAETSEIKAAYLAAAKRYHPDALARAGLDDTTRAHANRVFGEISKAHSMLSDPRRRREYDLSLGSTDSAADADRLANAESLFRKGDVLLRAGNFKGAIEFLQPAVELWPEEPAYQAALGWALYKKLPSEPERARDHLAAAAARAEEDPLVLFRLGVVLRTLGDEATATELIAHARKLDPGVG